MHFLSLVFDTTKTANFSIFVNIRSAQGSSSTFSMHLGLLMRLSRLCDRQNCLKKVIRNLCVQITEHNKVIIL